MSAAPPHAADLLFSEGLVTVTEACSWLSISRSFLYSAMESGEIPFVRLGRARRIPKRAVVEYAARHLDTAQVAR